MDREVGERGRNRHTAMNIRRFRDCVDNMLILGGVVKEGLCLGAKRRNIMLVNMTKGATTQDVVLCGFDDQTMWLLEYQGLLVSALEDKWRDLGLHPSLVNMRAGRIARLSKGPGE